MYCDYCKQSSYQIYFIKKRLDEDSENFPWNFDAQFSS